MESNQFKGFSIISELGSGAFSSTVLAERDGRKAAIKLISLPNKATIEAYSEDYIKTPEFAQALKNTGGELNKLLKSVCALPPAEGILKYYDYAISLNKDAGTYELAILTQAATPLVSVISGGMPVGAVLRMGAQLCEGLELMLKKFIMHGNIKESNIFYDAKSGFMLGDFYINDILSSALTPDKNFSSYGYRFLAPEAYTDDEYSYKTDIFSLGMLLYKMFNNNKLPFEADDGCSLKAIKEAIDEHKELPPPEYDIPEITKVLRKATAYSQNERYASFLQLKASLTRLLTTLPKEILYTKIGEGGFAAPPNIGINSAAPGEKKFTISKEKLPSKAAEEIAENKPAERAETVTKGSLFEKAAPPREPNIQVIEDDDDIPPMPAIVPEQHAPKTEPEAPKPAAKPKPPKKEITFEAPKPEAEPQPHKAEPKHDGRNPLMPPDDFTIGDENKQQRKVRQLEHYEAPSGVTERDLSLSAIPEGEKGRGKVKLPGENYDYFDFNSEDYDLDPSKKNRRIIIITAIIIGGAVLAVTIGFLVKLFMK